MAKYKLVKQINFGSGFLHDRTGKAVPVQNFAPKIGDVIEQVGVTPDSLKGFERV